MNYIRNEFYKKFIDVFTKYKSNIQLDINMEQISLVLRDNSF